MRHVCPECGESGEAGTCDKDAVPRAPVGTDELLGTQIGSWRIARSIGAGGMGRVYLGVQPAIGARVAIKILKDAADPDLVERFFNEARAVNVIRHEAIVDVIDLGKLPSGAPYIVMEFLEGVPLRALIKRVPRPPAGALAKILVDVLGALEAAHAAGVIHRDLKPDNVFVSPGGRVTVLDFGIAKLARDSAVTTRTGGLLGTPAYMSPEQARAQSLDARSDLYSVGVILYEAATGELPFSAPSMYELLDQHVKATARSPRDIDPAIPEALQVVILRALAKDPADRFQTATEMRAALVGVLDDLPKAELVLPAISGLIRVPTSDPLAPTAVTRESVRRDDSLAFDKTKASGNVTSPGRDSTPRHVGEKDTETGMRVSRPLVAVMAGSALLGLGAVGYVVLRSPPAAKAIDAAVPIDAPVDAPRIDLSAGPVTLPIQNLETFDPVAYFPTALAKAEQAAGGKVTPSKLTFRDFDRNGRIDVTAGGSVEYFFAIDKPTDEYCYLLVILEQGTARLNRASPTEGKCTGHLPPPRCTMMQLWERAIAAGIPANATKATVNLMGSYWVFSVEGVDDYQNVKNDCD